MGQRQDGAIGEAVDRPGGLAEMIGDEDGLAVARHQCVDRAEQDRGGHGEENGASAPARDLAEPLSHSAMEPVLNGEKRLHQLV